MIRALAYILFQALLLHCIHGLESLRIMPMGDALTYGSNSVPGAYRTELYRSLTEYGYEINIVGNEQSGDSSELSEKNHEGHKSFDIADMIDHVDEFLDRYDPDIILLMIGTRDVFEGEDFENAVYKWDRLIGKIASSRPNSHIFAANLPPRKNSNQNDRIQELFNAFAPNLVDAHVAAGREVTFVDVNAVVSVDDLETNVHPNAAGYTAIGYEFAAAIRNVVSPAFAGIPRGLLRVEGGLNRRQIIVTFTKPIPNNRATADNFSVNKLLSILDVSLDDEKRVVTLTTSEQSPAETYKLTVHQGIQGIQGNNVKSFSTGWRILSFADWHLGGTY